MALCTDAVQVCRGSPDNPQMGILKLSYVRPAVAGDTAEAAMGSIEKIK